MQQKIIITKPYRYLPFLCRTPTPELLNMKYKHSDDVRHKMKPGRS